MERSLLKHKLCYDLRLWIVMPPNQSAFIVHSWRFPRVLGTELKFSVLRMKPFKFWNEKGKDYLLRPVFPPWVFSGVQMPPLWLLGASIFVFSTSFHIRIPRRAYLRCGDGKNLFDWSLHWVMTWLGCPASQAEKNRILTIHCNFFVKKYLRRNCVLRKGVASSIGIWRWERGKSALSQMGKTT